MYALTSELVDLMILKMTEAWGYPNTEVARLRFVSGVGEEAGELVGAYHRWSGLARRWGSKADVENELADVIIMAVVTGRALGIDIERAVSDKLDIVMTRGWKEPAGTGDAQR